MQCIEDDESFNLDLWTASSIGDLEFLQGKIDFSNVNQFNQSSWTCLMYATYNDHSELVSYLLNFGALVHISDRTALMLAATCGHCKVLDVLLREVKDNVKDGKGYSALFHAVLYGHYDACKLLLLSGSDANTFDNTE